MNKQILLDLLTNILRSQEYGVSPRINETHPGIDLVVEKGESVTCIQYGGTENDLRYFANAVQGVHDALFISEEITDQMALFADRYNIRRWDRSELEIRIGKAILADAEDVRYDLLDQVYPADMTPETIEIANDSLDMLQLRCASIRVDEKRAIATARGFVRGITDATIEFVPFWNYKYAIDTHRQHKTKTIHISSEDSGAINALNKEKHEYITHGKTFNISASTPKALQEVCDSISVPCKNYEIKSPIVTKDEASKEILNDAIESNTKNISSTSTAGDAIITEHRTVKPGAKDIDLDMELVYLPVWEVKGVDGSIMIDAYSGIAMTAPIDNDVEFL